MSRRLAKIETRFMNAPKDEGVWKDFLLQLDRMIEHGKDLADYYRKRTRQLQRKQDFRSSRER